MVLSLIYGRKYAKSQIKQRRTNVALITFDAILSEDHKFNSRATYYPIENGTLISDHIINQPAVISISGIISDTPLNIFATFNRSVSAFNTLIQLHEQKQIVDIVTGIRVYNDMAITVLDVPRDMKTGQTLTFNIQFQKVNFTPIQVFRERNNVFAGVEDVTPREIVAENTNIPIIQNDPPFSLKDQASSPTNVGVQSLTTIPTAVLPNVLTNLNSIYGVVT